jgi:uncharacterized protein YaiE (UPF0345 family)
MIKVSEYFEGKVKSLGQVLKGQKFTVGVMEPGEFTFSTGAPEVMEVVLGAMEVQLPDGSRASYAKGQTFSVPGNSSFVVKVNDPVSYICFYD